MSNVWIGAGWYPASRGYWLIETDGAMVVMMVAMMAVMMIGGTWAFVRRRRGRGQGSDRDS